MLTTVKLADRDALLAHVRELLASYPSAPAVTHESVRVEPYCYDSRIDWDTYLVTLDGYGVVGYTDGPMS